MKHADSAAQPQADLKELVLRLDALPAPSPVAGRILALAAREDVNLGELTQVLEADPAVCARLLRLANSASHGAGGAEVVSVRQAIMKLGLSVVRTVALCVVVREGLLARAGQDDPSVRAVWEHSLACAAAAQLLAERVKPSLAGTAFAAGLLHDLGKLAMLAVMPARADELVRSGLFADRLLAREQAVLGADHCLAGKWLLERWAMPGALVDAVWLHHQPPAMFAGLLAKGEVLPLVALADLMAREAMGQLTANPADARRRQLFTACGLTDEGAVEEIKANIGKRFAERAGLFSLSEDPAAFYFKAVERANQTLGRVGLELAASNQRLTQTSRWLAGVAGAGAHLEDAPDAPAVLGRLRDTLGGPAFGAPEGMAYVLDAEGRTMASCSWGAGAPGPSALQPLGEGPPPLPGRQDGLPPAYARLMSGAAVRLGALSAGQGACTHAQEGFLIATARLRDPGSLMEIIYRPAGGSATALESEALAHLAGLAGAALRRQAILAQSNSRAERLAEAMRNVQALNAKLLQTERLAAVGQLAAGAAHEINNPLAIISARAQLLEMKESDPAKKRGFRQMVEQIERISQILSNLMDFARPAPLSMGKVSLPLVLSRVLELTRDGLDKAGVAVRTEIEGDLPEILADARQLEQVFLNLVINAQHAMEGQGGTLGVTAAYNQAADNLTVTVTDTGQGIARENLDKIFDPFFTTKAEGKGTGLGLSTSYGIIAKHQGDIRVASQVGQGTRVTVVLPRDASFPKLGAEAAAMPERRPGEEAILVVDDEKHIRDILCESLESSGYAVAQAADGEQALEMLAARRFRLMILDMRMPRRDGLTLLREAADHIPATMPVMVLTGLAGEEEIRQAMELGVAACMRKPFNIDALLGEVKRLLDAPQGP